MAGFQETSSSSIVIHLSSALPPRSHDFQKQLGSEIFECAQFKEGTSHNIRLSFQSILNMEKHYLQMSGLIGHKDYDTWHYLML